jgi:hypothetical protein
MAVCSAVTKHGHINGEGGKHQAAGYLALLLNLIQV